MTENLVAVVRGTSMLEGLREVISMSDFDSALTETHGSSGKQKDDFKIVIKPNMMVFVNPVGHHAVVTDKDMVEALVDHIRSLGFANITLCEAQHDVGRLLKNHNVGFVAEAIGYRPHGRYRIVDLSLESVPYPYEYIGHRGRAKIWKDFVGVTWRDADFRISFAKCKTHEHDWMTLAVKNIYGCFPATNKIARYHMRNEVFDVTARSLRNFPVHFCFVDAWVGSDGFQGYKIANPKTLNMLFGGRDPIAVDIEIFTRAGVDAKKSRILKRAVEQVYQGVYPTYSIVGDRSTRFGDVCEWQNIDDDVVNAINRLEEVYVAWGLINLRPTAELVDFSLFPPKNFINRLGVWLLQKVHAVVKLTDLYRKFYPKRP